MEKQQILRMLNRKAFFSWAYLIMAAASIFVYVYFWHIHEYDYVRDYSSPMSRLDETLPIGAGFWFVLTAIIYFTHFIGGAIAYPTQYRDDIEMDMDFAEPESEKVSGDGSNLRGLFIGVVWVIIFYYSFRDFFPITTLVRGIVYWLLFHVLLAFLTSTSGIFKLITQTLDLTIIAPDEYPGGAGNDHVLVEIYFFIPKSVDEATWCENYLKEYVEYKKTAVIEETQNEKQNEQQIKNLSEKLARAR